MNIEGSSTQFLINGQASIPPSLSAGATFDTPQTGATLDTPPAGATAGASVGATLNIPLASATFDIPPTGRLDKNQLLMDVSAILIMMIQFYRTLRMTYRDAEAAQLDVEVAAMKSIAEKMMTAANEMLDARLSEAIAGIVMGGVEAGVGAYSIGASMRASPESKRLKVERQNIDKQQGELTNHQARQSELELDADGRPQQRAPQLAPGQTQAGIDAQRADLNRQNETQATVEHTKQLRRQVVMQGVGGLVQAGKSTGSLVAGLHEYDARMADAAQKLIETVQKTAAFGRERTHDMSAESTEMLNQLLRTLGQLWTDEQAMQQVLLQKLA